MNWWRSITILACVLGVGLPARGQAPIGPDLAISVAPVVGIAALTGDRANEFDPSICFGGEADIRVAPLVTLTATVVHNEFRPKFVSATVDEKATFLEFGAGAKYVLTPTPLVRPYIRAGAGLYRWDSGGLRTETDLGVNGGAGVDFDLPGARVGFTLAARFHKIFVAGSSWQYFNVYGGVRFALI